VGPSFAFWAGWLTFIFDLLNLFTTEAAPPFAMFEGWVSRLPILMFIHHKTSWTNLDTVGSRKGGSVDEKETINENEKIGESKLVTPTFRKPRKVGQPQLFKI
jgi:hypothetical protein